MQAHHLLFDSDHNFTQRKTNTKLKKKKFKTQYHTLLHLLYIHKCFILKKQSKFFAYKHSPMCSERALARYGRSQHQFTHQNREYP